jgi:L-ascorbate metabolism protein UlaG (beta-lactamase superfamily)
MKILVAASLAFLVLSCASVERPFDESAWRSQVQQADPALLRTPYFKDGKYFNPWLPMEERAFGAYVMMRMFARKADYTEEEEQHLPKVLPDAPERLSAAKGDFILWIGHGTFLMRLGGEYWLTDPVFSNRVLLPERRTPPAITPKDLAGLDGPLNIVISHNHYDHLDKDSIGAMPAGSRFYVPLGLGGLVRKYGAGDVVEMDWWTELETTRGTRLTCLPAQHWSRRITQGRNSSLWASFLITSPGTRVYFAGDSGSFIGFREIGRVFPGIDYALMPVTAYRPRWFMHYAHMDVREALDAFRDLGARFFVPTQWGTFRLGEEPAGYAGLELRREIRSQRLDPARFLVLDIGGLVEVPWPPRRTNVPSRRKNERAGDAMLLRPVVLHRSVRSGPGVPGPVDHGAAGFHPSSFE